MDGLSLIYGIVIGVVLPPISVWITKRIQDAG